MLQNFNRDLLENKKLFYLLPAMDVDCKEYSIGDVAKMLNLPVHTIRFWTDEFSHIECLRRKNRRYYDIKSVNELKKIKELSHQKGIKIDGIKQMIRYRKIDMEKMEEVGKKGIQIKLDNLCEKIEMVLEKVKKC